MHDSRRSKSSRMPRGRHTASPRWTVMLFVAMTGLAFSFQAYAQSSVELVTPKLTIEEKVNKGDEYMTTMNDILQQSVATLEQARSANDVERIAKVREAVVAMRGLLRLSQQNLDSLRSAAAARDERKANSEFVKLTMAYNKFLELDAEIRSAGGPGNLSSAGPEGQPTVQGQVDSDVPQLNPDSGVQNFGVLLDRPPSTSGTL